MEWLRLLAAAGLLALAIFVVFPAPTFRLFVLSVAATEYGHFFAPLAFLLFVLPPWDGLAGMAGAVLSGVGFLALSSPCLRALMSARRLKHRLETAFACSSETPFISFRRLWRVETKPRVAPEPILFAGPGSDLLMEFYRCPGSGSALKPAIVVVHGGGWMAGHPSDMAPMCGWLAERGFHVASLGYRLVPNAAWPAQLEDLQAGIAFLRSNPQRIPIDPGRLILFGRSAGGQLAGALALGSADPAIRGCVCLYAPIDMLHAYRHSREDDILRSRWLLRSFLGGAPDAAPDAFRQSSAYHLAHRDGPPFFLLHGGRDELVHIVQSRRFAVRLADLGASHCLLELPWATHACDFNLHGPSGQIISNAVLAFATMVSSMPARHAANPKSTMAQTGARF